MLSIAVILLVLWAVGMFGGYAMGGLLHLLLVVAVIMLATRFFDRRRVV
jgi:uncharacterized protein DUF5670